MQRRIQDDNKNLLNYYSNYTPLTTNSNLIFRSENNALRRSNI